MPPAAPTTVQNDTSNASASFQNQHLTQMYPKPVTLLVIGMAGSGKTTLLQVSKSLLEILTV
jgi:ABC-type lipoprotein export system ATPase subunit